MNIKTKSLRARPIWYVIILTGVSQEIKNAASSRARERSQYSYFVHYQSRGCRSRGNLIDVWGVCRPYVLE